MNDPYSLTRQLVDDLNKETKDQYILKKQPKIGMSKEEYFVFAQEFFEKCLNISKAKNADYTAGDQDPFSNFKAADPEWTEIGFYTRMMDKMQRIKAYIKAGKLEVKDESVIDTLRDLANYSSLLAGYLSGKK